MTVMLKRRGESGFTVIEILIGIALFGLIMPSIILGVTNVAALNDRAADLTRANIIAEAKIESLRSQGYNSLNDGDVIDFESELDDSFTAPRTATYSISEPSGGVKQIDVFISYYDRGSQRNLNYSSLITELGVAQ